MKKLLVPHVNTTLSLLVAVILLSADNLYKQFGPRLGPMSVLIWIQTVCHSDSVP